VARGWEHCGHGEAWYAERFRPPVRQDAQATANR